MTDLRLPVPEEFLDALAERVAEILIDRLRDELTPRSGRWMRSNEAAEYLGWSRGALYSRVSSKSIPHYKIDGLLVFKKDDLDAWLEQYRQDPAEREPQFRAGRSFNTPPRRSRASSEPAAAKAPEPTQKRERPKRERPLPPPLGGTKPRRITGRVSLRSHGQSSTR